jgi:hypothetical protein
MDIDRARNVEAVLALLFLGSPDGIVPGNPLTGRRWKDSMAKG